MNISKYTKISLAILFLLQDALMIIAQNKPDVFSTPTVANFVTTFGDYTAGIKVNKVVTYTIRKKISDEQLINSLNPQDVSISITYYDGLNRPIQSVNKRASPTGKDIISLHKYDEFGRSLFGFLPYGSNTTSGDFHLNAFSEQYGFNSSLYTDDEVFYSKVDINENSLEAESKFMKVGNTWAGNNVGETKKYGTNGLNEVRIWTLDLAGNPTTTSYYDESKLLVSEHIDEENQKVMQYYDFGGNLVLSKTQADASPMPTSHTGWNCTYFVYDDYNQLVYTISPKAVSFLVNNNWDINSNPFLLSELCNHAAYDDLGRVVSQKLAGQEVAYFVYDNKNRVVLSQDGNNRANGNKWSFVKYDKLGRSILNGVYFNAANHDRVYLQNQMKLSNAALNTFLGFLQMEVENNTYNTASTIPDASILNISYYDNYSQTPNFQYNDAEVQTLPGGINAENHIQSNEVFGMQTGSYSRIIDGNVITSNWIGNVNYYDEKRHLIQSIAQNHKNGIDRTSFKYNFSGNVISNSFNISNPNSLNVPMFNAKNKYSYNSYGYLTASYLGTNYLNNFAYRRLNAFQYNQLGQVASKNLGATVETQEYQYKPWGALESINKDYCLTGNGSNFFGEVLCYDYGFNVNRKDGYLAGMKWRMRGSNNKQRAYGYLYDEAGRLKEGYYTEHSGVVLGSGPVWDNIAENYTAENMTYDENGNLLTMKQWGVKTGYATPFLMDELTYDYDHGGMSNKLKNVSDNIQTNFELGEFHELGSDPNGDYAYDDNGNITTDYNKNITSITYNELNKPALIVFTGNRNISFKYDANGTRLSKTITEGTGPTQIVKVIDYLYGAEYENENLLHIPHAEGRIRPVNLIVQNSPQIGFELDYFVKDHQGNVRSTLTEEWVSNWYDYIDQAQDVVTALPPSEVLDEFGFKGATICWKDYLVTNELINQVVETSTFDNVDETREAKVGSLDPNDAFNTLLNGNNANKLIGPSMVLRVMAGDSLKIKTGAKYSSQNANTSTQFSLEDVVNSLLEALNGNGGFNSLNESGLEAGLTQNSLTNCTFLDRLQEVKNNTTTNGNTPQAFLNYIFLDENLNVVPENSGLVQTTTPDQWNELSVPKMEAKRSGYFFVFLSNESMMNVYFDNLNVAHYKGKLMDESHYYPYGLTITKSAIVNTPLNNVLFGSKSLERKEFSDGTGLDWYNFDVRAYDPQIGRWHQPDPFALLAPNWTPYRYGFSNPANYTDPSGLFEDGIGDGESQAPVGSCFWDECGDVYERTAGNEGELWDDKLLDLNNPVQEEIESNTDVGSINEIEVIAIDTEEQEFDEDLGVVFDLDDSDFDTEGDEGFWSTSIGQSLNNGMTFINQNLNPVYMLVNGGQSAFTGKDLITGSQMSGLEPALQFGGGLTFVYSAVLSGTSRAYVGIASATTKTMSASKGVHALRAAYVKEVEGLSSIASKMRTGGSSSEEIARTLHGLRRELGVKYKSLTPDNVLQQIYQRNLQKYGDKLGPSIDYLRQQGKSWDDIINSATRTGGKDLGF